MILWPARNGKGFRLRIIRFGLARQVGRGGYTLLMKLNRDETAVQWFHAFHGHIHRSQTVR